MPKTVFFGHLGHWRDFDKILGRGGGSWNQFSDQVKMTVKPEK